MRREFLQLAKTYDPQKYDVSGFFISEKLDGTRCFWDGGITRGLPTTSVPWASVTHPKTGLRKSKIKPISTGLWSRYGNPIMAPDWWLNQLPCCFLDGELWAGRGQFQLNRSIVAGDEPDPRFDQIVFAVYSSPAFDRVFGTGEIKNSNFIANFDLESMYAWVDQNSKIELQLINSKATFEQELKFLNEALDNGSGSVYLHKQIRLPDSNVDETINRYLDDVVEGGGEGVIIRNPESIWTPKRVKDVLKYKPFLDAEGALVGFTSGRETDKGSKLKGLIGALILDYQGNRLELSGLTDSEREFATEDMTSHAFKNPGIDMPSHFCGRFFKVGDTISFKYRELTDAGIPKEARYFRII